MKRILLLLTVTVVTVMMLAGCSAKDKADMKEDVSTFVSEAKEDLDDMIDNATVSDGDGHIGDQRDEVTVSPTESPNDMDQPDTETVVEDATEDVEMTEADAFI